MSKVVSLALLLSIIACPIVQCQDSLALNAAEVYYKELYNDRNEYLRSISLDYYSKHGKPRPIDVMDSLNRTFYRIRLSELSNSLDSQAESTSSFQDSLELLLKIREYQEGGSLPDPFFDTLLQKYYEVFPTKALAFCLQRFDYYRYHEKDRDTNVESWRSFHLYRYPYIEFLFKQLNSSELADLLLHQPLDDPERNEKMVDKFIEAMQASWKPAELESIKDYLEIKKSFYSTHEINIFFVESMLKER